MDRFLKRNTAEQVAIITHPCNADELVLIEAVAGSGKTHTIVERALKTSTPSSRSLILAFNTAAKKHVAQKIDAYGAGSCIKAKTTTVYAKAWDNKVRMHRHGHRNAWAAIPLIIANTKRLYDERLYLRLLGLLQVRSNGDRVRGNAPERLLKIVRTLSSLKTPVTPKTAGWNVKELRNQWLFLKRPLHDSIDALREAWTDYAATVLQPLFPYVTPDELSSSCIDLCDARQTEPRTLSIALLEDMCFAFWFDGQHQLVSQYNNASLKCAWSVMWLQWFSEDVENVVASSRPADGQTFDSALKKFVARWKTVYVDEAQDLNGFDLSMMAYHYTNGAQVVLVGDRLQSLYGFRNCVNAFCPGVRAMRFSVPAKFETTFKLSTSFRVPSATIEYLNDTLTEFDRIGMTSTQPHAGRVVTVDVEHAVQQIVGDTFVLGNWNVEVAHLAVAYLKSRPKTTIRCSDTLFRRIKPKRKQLNKATALPVSASARLLNDDSDADERDSAARLEAAITITHGADAFLDLYTAVKCGSKVDEPFFSSVHSAKGLEARRVVLASDVTTVDRNPENDCRLYVAMTRAKHAVFCVRQAVETHVFNKKRRTGRGPE